MPRSHTIARLVVDRPQFSNTRREAIADWLECRAEEIESEPNCYTTGTFRARIMNPYLPPERPRAWAGLKVDVLGHLSLPTRKRIAKWLRSRAKHLRSERAVFEGRWFRQDFAL